MMLCCVTCVVIFLTFRCGAGLQRYTVPQLPEPAETDDREENGKVVGYDHESGIVDAGIFYRQPKGYYRCWSMFCLGMPYRTRSKRFADVMLPPRRSKIILVARALQDKALRANLSPVVTRSNISPVVARYTEPSVSPIMASDFYPYRPATGPGLFSFYSLPVYNYNRRSYGIVSKKRAPHPLVSLILRNGQIDT